MGHLFGPDNKNGTPRTEYPWALDNGVYGAWQAGSEWSEEPLYRFLDEYGFLRPAWVVVPDWVGDRDATLRLWDEHAPALLAYGVPLAMAVQDGMTSADVPSEAAVVFVGGTASWKWRTLLAWTTKHERVHVGRVNGYDALWRAHTAGAESVDGTGYFREPARTVALERYLKEATNGGQPQEELCFQ